MPTRSNVVEDRAQSVVVFGASRGIGAAVAEEFSRRGHKVVGTHRGSGVPEGVTGIIADITSTTDIDRVLAEAAEMNGPVDIIVVATGITRDALLLRQSEEDMRALLETNFIGPASVAKAALRPLLKNRGGSIVIVSAISARVGVVGQTNYTASKAALEGFIRSYAREYGAKGIRINLVAPGPTDTDMLMAVPEKERAEMLTQIPLGRLGQPHEIAEVVYWVSQSTFMTGATVPVAGGAGLGY